MRLEINEREWSVIVGALRAQEEAHKRNDFKALVLEIQGLRSKVNDARIADAMSASAIRQEIDQLMSEIQTPIKG